MKLLAREIVTPPVNGRPVFPGFISYCSTQAPHLIWRSGWEDFSDGYDDFADRISLDNGKTWSDPVIKLKKHQSPQGTVRYAENACFLDPDKNLFWTFCSKGIYPDTHCDPDNKFFVVYDCYNPQTQTWRGEKTVDIDLPGDLVISFCFPIKTRDGRIIIPAMTKMTDPNGNPIHYQDCWAPAHQSLALIADYNPDNSLTFSVGSPVSIDLNQSTRGTDENVITELPDHRLAMICRGSNTLIQDKPGYKWLCFSTDQGQTWSPPTPLPCDQGDPIESSATGSALFRSSTNQKLYWMGNLCIDGTRPDGNWPRTPLVIAEMSEDPFAIKRDSIFVIDRQAPHEPDQVQHSNFRFYQDRATGNLTILLTRYGENSAQDWMNANHYRYTLQMPD